MKQSRSRGSTAATITISHPSHSRSQFRQSSSRTVITSDSRVRTTTKYTLIRDGTTSSQSRGNINHSKLDNLGRNRSAVDTKKYLQSLSILDIHESTFPTKKHKPMDLSPFLVEQPDPDDMSIYGLPKHQNIEIQCDKIEPRPLTPYKIKGKTGLDMGIQCDGDDLFDFDRDIEALLTVIIDKTLDQSLTEIRNEYTLKTLQNYHAKLTEKSNLEKARIKAMEDKERERYENKEKLLEERLYQQRKENALKEKAFSIRIANTFLDNLMEDTLNNLEELNIFRSPILKDIEQNFIQKLTENVSTKINFFHTINEIVDDIIKNTVFDINQDSLKNIDIVLKQQKCQDMIHLFVNVDTDKIGPLQLTKYDHIHHIENSIRSWYLKERNDNLQNAEIQLKFNGKPISKEMCLGNLDLVNGLIEMRIIRQDPETENDNDEDPEQE